MSDHGYRRWRLPQLWQMLAADNPTDAHLHLATLRRQQTALETQRDRLRTLRDRLADGWPPERSEAATAFIQRLNDMIRAMSLTATGAAEVRSNLSLITDALDRARRELAPLVAEYEKTTKLPDQRVGEHARRLLDDHARRILMTADAAVSDPAAALDVALPAYERFSMQGTVAVPVDGGGGSTGTRTGRPATPQFDPPEPAAAEPPEFELAGGSGPTSTVTPVADPAGSIGGLVDHSVLGPGRVLGRVVRPTGVAAAGPGATNGNPGVRGGALNTQSAIGAPGSGAAGARGGVGGMGGYRASDTATSRRRTPEEGGGESWSVRQGVPPVIEAPPSRPHDAGPGIIGIDR
ncbi:hypothetical protein Daura_09060 [Dactylosporangium aurantiacum]|uniref:Uncharacterized protein n=1 Tax=Dactylosporangium aurantiacum TaxID=35754 RepID=A0A9Q9MH35_9ACTN|nr:hypothetical protein [Dactylosporangium aurantiacum]MDG6109760.1 hypothetical protein [Dactylosporangium aurantiacum]UWZ56304.1 hypothetical protein Daura_09060 [Dactylosporangium aurantiacum]